MMTTRSFASLAFNLLGTYMLVVSVAGLHAIPAALYSFPMSQTGLSIGPYVLMLLLPFVPALIFGVVLIAKSNLFAQWAVSAEGQVEEVILTGKAAQSLAFSALGVAFFVFGVARVVGVVTLLMTTRTVDPRMYGGFNTYPRFWPDFAEGLVELLVGAYLFFGAESLSKLWHRIQKLEMPPLTGEQKP